MHQRFSTPKIQVSPRERVMWRLCYFPWGFATGALLPWELQKHLREGYLWLVHAFANAAGLSQPRITEIWPLDPTLVSCDILGMCYTIQALVQPRRKNYIYIINNYFENNYNHFNIILFQKILFSSSSLQKEIIEWISKIFRGTQKENFWSITWPFSFNRNQMNEDWGFHASKKEKRKKSYCVFQLFLEQLYQSKRDMNLWTNDSFESHIINESNDPVHIWMVHLQTW